MNEELKELQEELAFRFRTAHWARHKQNWYLWVLGAILKIKHNKPNAETPFERMLFWKAARMHRTLLEEWLLYDEIHQKLYSRPSKEGLKEDYEDFIKDYKEMGVF